MKIWKVNTVFNDKKDNTLKKLSLESFSDIKKNKTIKKNISLPRNFILGKSDLVSFKGEKIFLHNQTNLSKSFEINKIWKSVGSIDFCKEKIKYEVCECITEEDIKNYKDLSFFHYRTEEDGTAKKGGRSAILLIYLKIASKKICVGYIQLQMPVMMCKPRHQVFKNPFKNDEINWETWDSEARKKYVNRIVRIGRVVTHPEWRGMNIAKILIEKSKIFSLKKWHCKGEAPIFIEISAQMLKHIDFVSSSGFHFLGMTEGNLSRVARDLKYMNRGYLAKTGVMTMQKKYLNNFKILSNEIGLPFEKALIELEKICEKPNLLTDLPLEKWLLFTSAIRFPIPYYVCGLTKNAKAYLKENVPKEKKVITPKVKFTSNSIRIENFKINAKVIFSSKDSNRKIQTAFGLKKPHLNQSIIKEIKGLTIKSGESLFLSGASGSGKTLLLDAIQNLNKLKRKMSVSGEVKFLKKASIGKLRNLCSKETLIEVLSKKYGFEKSIYALNKCGLSEAYIYLKKYNLLSEGQKYRASFSDLLLSNKSIWIIDEFCADLDPISAKIVCFNLKKHIKEENIIAILAAANNAHFIEALEPEVTLELSSGGTPKVTYN